MGTSVPHVIFTHDFDWAPPEFNGRWLKAYKAGWSGLVTTPCAVAATAAGKAQRIGETEEPRASLAETGGDTACRALGRKAGARSKR